MDKKIGKENAVFNSGASMEKDVIWSAEDVINKCKEYMNEEHVAIVQKACDFATYVHREQFRKSGGFRCAMKISSR